MPEHPTKPATDQVLLDPAQLLIELAESCTRTEDAAFWILTSAAAHVDPNYKGDSEGSTAAAFYWNRLFPCYGEVRR
jgi:hypothetical protein